MVGSPAASASWPPSTLGPLSGGAGPSAALRVCQARNATKTANTTATSIAIRRHERFFSGALTRGGVEPARGRRQRW